MLLTSNEVVFDRFRFDLHTGQLWAGEEELRLTPKAAAVLTALVKQAGTPVSKEELFAEVWADTIVTDDALTSCIQEIRKTLDDDAKQPRYIETRHRRGYRFVAKLSGDGEFTVGDPAQPTTTSIAVLPFLDMSPMRDHDYLCEGIAEELINALTKVDGLHVASRTASFQFRNPGADVQSVGAHLKVGLLLEGSVRKAGDQLRVTVQLIEVETGYHHWSARFDRDFTDIFTIQDEIAENVVQRVRGQGLKDVEQQRVKRPQTESVAYELYLRARHHLHLLTRPDLERAIDLFEQAIAVDPQYAPAWGCMSAAYATLYEWFGAREEYLRAAEEASRNAARVAPHLAESHTARGIAHAMRGNFDEAAREFDTAILLNPHNYEAYYYYARACFGHGDIALSAELFARAADVRREDFQSVMLQGQSLRIMGRLDEAREVTREGIRRAEQMLAMDPTNARALSLGSGALYEDGQHAKAKEWADRALTLHPHDAGVLVNVACLCAKDGRKEEAIGVLERVFALGWGKRAWIEHDTDYDILRDDPRFQRMVASLR